jgi:hypothetical protein
MDRRRSVSKRYSMNGKCDHKLHDHFILK